jgi:hypothetical protein
MEDGDGMSTVRVDGGGEAAEARAVAFLWVADVLERRTHE